MRAIVAGLATLPLLLAVGSNAQTPVFPGGTERVIVDVVVTDENGRPVAGLQREDFVVEDEGRPQTIIEFEAVDVAGAPAAATSSPEPSADIATNAPAPAASPRTFLIVFDDLNLSPASGKKVAAVLRKFLERHLRDTDCVTLAPTAGGAWWSGCLGSDRSDLAAALEAMRGRRVPNLTKERMSDYEALRIYGDNDREAMLHVVLRYMANGLAAGGASSQTRSDPQGQAEDMALASPLVQAIAADVYAQARARNEQLLRSVERGLRALAGGRGRRAVILASNGFIRDQRLPGFQRVREAARRSNAALYFVDAEDEEPEINSAAMPAHPDPENKFRYVAIAREYAAEENTGAEALAADTGGFTIRGADLDRGLAQLSAESRVFYLLGYAPAQPGKEGRFRKIKVSVRRPRVKVRARNGYYPGPAPTEPAAPDAPSPAARQALDAVDDARAVPVRMTTYVLGNAAESRIKVLLAAEVDPAAVTLKPGDGRLSGGLTSYSILSARDTGELGRKDRVHELALRPEAMPGMATTWLPVTHLYELIPGRYQARLVVMDRDSGRTGSVRHTFDVPSPGGFRLTTPVLTDVMAPGGGDAPAQPVPVARRAFASGSRLLCRVEAWGAASASPSLDIVYEVRRADGSVAARSEPKPLAPDAAGVYADVFKLTLHRPGEYQLRMRARDRTSGAEAAASRQFVVMPAATRN